MMGTGLPIKFRTLLRVALWMVAWPILAAIGAAIVIGLVRSWALRIRRLRTVRAERLMCLDGHPNPTLGRWHCARCGSEYAGWIGRCETCGDETADWLACRVCRLAVRLPWRPPR
jgi:hypothetical protein